MKPFRVMTVVGTRPEIIRLSRVIAKLDAENAIHHTLVHTGQNYDYELNKIFFEQLEIRKPDYFLEAAGDDPIDTSALVQVKINPILRQEKPDALLILGDTNSCLCAYPAKRLKIPIFHMEAGNRCFDMRVPEEINRRLVDHVSDINMTYSQIARQYLLKEGLQPERVICTGSPLKEVLDYYTPNIDKSEVLAQLGVEPFEYFLLSSHREENIDSEINFNLLVGTLNSIAERFKKKIIVTTHPRTRARIESTGTTLNKLVSLQKPFGLFDYVKLQKNAMATISDSGTVTEESSILNIPAVNIRNAHERPEGMEEGSVIMAGLAAERVLQALEVISGQKRGSERTLKMVRDYDVDNVSEKVLRIILSYTDYVNRFTWHKMV